MYAEAQQRQAGGQIRGGALGSIGANETIARTEIDGELFDLNQHVDRLDNAVKALIDRLYPVLAGHLSDACNGSAAPTPIKSSPLGQSLRSQNDRLYELANAVDSIRARIQL